MPMFQSLRQHRRTISLTACFLLSIVPTLSAQTGKELMDDACYIELQQRNHNTLWASHVERHTAGHIYLEEEIETQSGVAHICLAVQIYTFPHTS
jgi:hypothetical protein